MKSATVSSYTMSENLSLFEAYSNAEELDTLRELLRVNPSFINSIARDITYFRQTGNNFLESIPNLFHFIKIFAPLAKRVDEAHTQSDVLSVTKDLKDLEMRLAEFNLGNFTASVTINIGNSISNMRHLLIELDMKRYKEYFNSHVPMEVFNYFSTGKEVPGLPSSLQGTLAASEVLSRENNISSLNRELNLIYPGAGGHLTPLIMAFDLFDRDAIDRANLLLNDISDNNEYIHEALKKFEKAEIITNLQVVVSEEDSTRTKYLFMYNNHPICLEFLQSDYEDVADWKINDRDPNVVYDHIPFTSAPPGTATRFFSANNHNRLHGLVFHIIPTSTIDVEHLAAGNRVVSSERVNDVSFANKNSWTVTGQNGAGLTVALVDYR